MGRASRPALALLAVLAGSTACGEPPRVVLVVQVDTLRADALGCYGSRARGAGDRPPSPNVDALAREGVAFDRAYSAAPWTIPSLATLFTGRWPWEHRALRLLEPLDGALPTLAERFRGGGWRTAGVSTNFVVKDEHGFARGFERWGDGLGTGHEGSTAHAAVDELLGFADELAERPAEGLFLWVLLFEPHYRYEEQPGLDFGPAYAGPLTGREELADLRRGRADLSPADVAFLRGLYQGEVARADEALGRLLRELERRGMMERALVAFTADHGEEIMDRGWIGHTRTLYDELVRVPLVLRLPPGEGGPRGTRSAHPVSQVDLGATLLELAGLEPRLGDGLSFAATVRGDAVPARRYLYLHTDFEPPLRTDAADEKRALQWGVVDARSGLKWVVDRRAAGGPAGRLFDLVADPGEGRDLAPERGGAPATLLRLGALDPADPEGAPTPLPVEDGGRP